jgi:hypothetical protein
VNFDFALEFTKSGAFAAGKRVSVKTWAWVGLAALRLL